MSREEIAEAVSLGSTRVVRSYGREVLIDGEPLEIFYVYPEEWKICLKI